MLDPASRGHPLHIALTEARCGTHGVRVIDEAFACNGDGFKATVWMARKTWHMRAVVHPPAVFEYKVIAE